MANLPEVNKFYVGSCLDILKSWPDNFIHTAICSPPYYSLRDYGVEGAIWDGAPTCQHEFTEYTRAGRGQEQPRPDAYNPKNKWAKFGKTVHGFCTKCGAWKGQLGLEPHPDMYIDHLVQIFRELRRCLRPDGTFWLNLGDTYSSSSFRDRYAVASQQDQLKAKYVMDLKPKDLMGIPWAAAFALRKDGWYLRSDVIWYSPGKCPETRLDRPTRAHEYFFLLTKSQDYFYDRVAIMEPLSTDQHEEYPLGRQKRSVWTVNIEPSKNYGPQTRVPDAIAHHATFPEALITPCVLAGAAEKGCCPDCGTPWNRIIKKEKAQLVTTNGNGNHADDELEAPEETGPIVTTGWEPGCKCGRTDTIPCLVFDPFMGSGTTAVVARKNGRSFLGTELNPLYADLAQRRIDFERVQNDL